MTPEEQALFDYLQSIYPRGLRNKAFEENTLIRKYDVVRAFILNSFVQDRNVWVWNLVIKTANEDGVVQRENFLQIPVDTTLSLEARKARLMTRLAGNPATKRNIRNVIEYFTWGWEETYKIEELWQELPLDPDDTWTYMVDLYNPQPSRRIWELIDILNQVHPAHCLLIMAYTIPVQDAIWIEAYLDSGDQTPFIRGEDGVPRATDRMRFGGTFIDWGYWS